MALVALRPFGPVDVVAVRALPVADGVRVVGRLWGLWGLWGLILRLHRRRRRRRWPRGHGRARRLTVRAASTIMARLVGIIDAVAVLRPVDDAHIMVSHSTRVLAVFIIARAAAVLHYACTAAPAWGWETRCGWRFFLARFCDVAAEREVAAMTCEATSDAPRAGVQQRQPKPRRPGCLIC